MKSKVRWMLGTGAVVLIAILVLVMPGPSFLSKPEKTSSGKSGTPASPLVTIEKPPPPPKPISTQLQDICNQLKASTSPAAARKLLSQLRNMLNALPHDVASREIQKFLLSGQDAGTHLDLTVKPGGHLDDASSMRVFLLDYLGSVDPSAAGVVAMQILANYTTPDEWAVSLRNYAWAHPNSYDRSFLQEKDRELLANDAWLKNSSAGYLQAFDSIVFAHDTATTPQLSALVRDKSNRAAAYAAYLTMDRLVIEEPKTMLKTLVDQPDLMKGRERTRADFIARADLAQPDERALVEKYLLDPSRGSQELAQFAAIYPNFNYMISDNLLTKADLPNRDIMVQRNQTALNTVEEWQNDPRFSALQPYLAQLHARLENLIQQTAQNSP